MTALQDTDPGTARLLGTWTMTAWYNEEADGTRHYPLGDDATGLISYTTDGYVFVSLSAMDRHEFVANDPFGGTPEENTRAMTSHITYSGRFVVEGDVVVHRVQHASCPNWIGSEQRRDITFHDTHAMRLSAAGAVFNGRQVTASVDWIRASTP